MTDAAALAHLVERTTSVFGRLDVACNNAAGASVSDAEGLAARPTPLIEAGMQGSFLCDTR